MPDPVVIDNNPNNPPNPAPAATPADGESAKTFDIETLPEEAWSEIFKHKRFSELIEAKNELKALREKDNKKKEDELKKNKEYEELSKKLEDERNGAIEEVRKIKLSSAIEKAAGKVGAVDTEAVLALIDRSKISIDENSGVVSGVDEAILELQNTKEYLFGKGARANVGNPTNPVNPNTGIRYKMSQLQDAKFFRENEADIKLAQRDGRIDNDLM